MTDQRTTFYVPDDREVIVFFEWQGPKGKHHCEANARGPQGAFTVMSSFDYDSTQPRFGGHWKMPLSDSTPEGDWVLASKVDGQEAGEVTFHVVAGAMPANAAKPTALPSMGEIYKATAASTVQIEKLDGDGKLMRVASGFFAAPGRVFTTFMAVDGARSLRVRLPDGKEVPADGLLAWDRRQDWAVVAVKSELPALQLAAAQSWNIGDPCYWFTVKGDTDRVFAQGQIVGVQSGSSNNTLQYVSNPYSGVASGGPLLDVRGHVIGVLGGLRPEALLSQLLAVSEADTAELYFATDTGTFVPISLLPATFPSQTTSWNDLWAKNEMMMPVINGNYIALALIRPAQPRNGQRMAGLTNSSTPLHRSDGKAEVELIFANDENLKSTTQLSLYDLDNHRLAAGDPQKLNVSKGQDANRQWELPLSALPAGIYRVDVAIGDGVAWRHYFKLVD
jgi:hypothetical protein